MFARAFHPARFLRTVSGTDPFREYCRARGARAWRSARAAAGIAVSDVEGKAAALGEELRAFFRRDAGTGRFCAVEAHRLPDAICLAARVADRVQLVEGFADGGEPALHR